MKRALGGAAVAAGLFIVATTPTRGIDFRAGTLDEVRAALGRGRPVLVDFSADWCVPCHELERVTFTHPEVIQAAREFDAFKVDLTRSDSPEAQAWTREYRIRGVPTVVFLAPDGREVVDARVESFLPAARFVERLRIAARASQRADRE